MGRYISTGSTQANACTLVGQSVCYQVNEQKYDYDGNSCWQNRVIIDTPGSYTFTVPAGVTCLRTIAIGGGGKASFAASASCNYGGAGGGYVEKTDTVASGCVVTIVVGRQQQDTTISYTSTSGARTLTAGGGVCCNPGAASGGDWNSIGGASGLGCAGGTYCGVGNCFLFSTCCGYCVVYSGYGITYSPDNSPGCCSGKAPGGGSAGSWMWACGGQGGGTIQEDEYVGGGYGPAAGGGGGIGYICKKPVYPAFCSCICTPERCANYYPSGRKSYYMGGTTGGGGTKLQRCDSSLNRWFSWRGMCVSGQWHQGPGGWGGYDNDEGRDARFTWFSHGIYVKVKPTAEELQTAAFGAAIRREQSSNNGKGYPSNEYKSATVSEIKPNPGYTDGSSGEPAESIQDHEDYKVGRNAINDFPERWEDFKQTNPIKNYENI